LGNGSISKKLPELFKLAIEQAINMEENPSFKELGTNPKTIQHYDEGQISQFYFGSTGDHLVRINAQKE